VPSNIVLGIGGHGPFESKRMAVL